MLLSTTVADGSLGAEVLPNDTDNDNDYINDNDNRNDIINDYENDNDNINHAANGINSNSRSAPRCRNLINIYRYYFSIS